MTHTPGPWTVVHTLAPEDYWWISGGEDRLALPLNESDACLMAAAPDLLAALRRLLTCDGSYDGTAGAIDEWFICMDEARAAIAKAEGK